MMDPLMMNKEVRNDVHMSLQSVRVTVARLQHDYAYLNHARSAGHNLLAAIAAFERQLIDDVDEHEDKLARVRAMHGGG